MNPTGEPLLELVRAVIAGDGALVGHLLAASPALTTMTYGDGTHRHSAKEYILEEVGHYVYVGDSALHIAAAAYKCHIALALIAAGANVRARNRRGAEPLHYAADGVPGSRAWNPDAQAATIRPWTIAPERSQFAQLAKPDGGLSTRCVMRRHRRERRRQEHAGGGYPLSSALPVQK